MQEKNEAVVRMGDEVKGKKREKRTKHENYRNRSAKSNCTPFFTKTCGVKSGTDRKTCIGLVVRRLHDSSSQWEDNLI